MFAVMSPTRRWRIGLAACGLVACSDGGGTVADASSGSPDTSTGATTSTSAEATSADTTATTGAIEPLAVDAGESRYALVGELVTLDGSGSTGAATYRWFLDDGAPPPEPGPDAIAEVTYDAPGRYKPVLTVYDEGGNNLSAEVTITVTHEPSHVPTCSGSIALSPGGDRIAVVSPDADQVTIIARTGDDFAVENHHAVCDEPRTIAWAGSAIAVACARDAIAILIPESGDMTEVALPRASRPFGVIVRDDELFVTLQATGELARLAPFAAPVLVDRIPALPDARGLALLPDGRIAVSRWRSTDAEAELAIIDPEAGTSEPATLQFDPKEASDTEAGGIPSYLDQILVSPQGDRIAIPSLQANIAQGAYLDGDPLIFDETLRGIVSYLELPGAVEVFESRKHFDNRGLMSAGVFNSRGDFLFLADRGSRSVERIDVFTGGQSGAILDVGFAPQGLALTPDDRWLLVDAYLSRELVVYDVTSFDELPQPAFRLATASSEPLGAEVLRGKQLFNDSFDPRLARDGYIACAHCHLDAEGDRRTWDFTDRGEGMRNTIGLLGRGGTAHGPIHWSANFDEVQDFENDIRGAFGGSGLMTDEAFETGTRAQTLGDPKAGVSADLDALAAYVVSLDAFLPSPWREPGGEATPEAQLGAVLFTQLGCDSCHAGATLTDSEFVGPADPLLHDVGTITAASGQRLGMPLPGLDTPTLRELWNSPPYLHDGSAATVREVFTVHNAAQLHGATAALTEQELDQLVAHLLALE